MSLITRHAIGFDIKVTWLAIARLYNTVATENGITVSVGFALLNIHETNGIRATGIAHLMGMEPTSLSRMLKSMEKQNLIYREPDPEDKRSVRIFLTEKGKDKQRKALQYVEIFNETIRKEVPADELNSFYNVLEKIHEIIDNRIIF